MLYAFGNQRQCTWHTYWHFAFPTGRDTGVSYPDSSLERAFGPAAENGMRTWSSPLSALRGASAPESCLDQLLWLTEEEGTKPRNLGPGRSLVARFSSRAPPQQALPKVVIWFLMQSFPLYPIFSCIHRCWSPRHHYAHSARWTPHRSDLPKQSCQI